MKLLLILKKCKCFLLKHPQNYGFERKTDSRGSSRKKIGLFKDPSQNSNSQKQTCFEN